MSRSIGSGDTNGGAFLYPSRRARPPFEVIGFFSVPFSPRYLRAFSIEGAIQRLIGKLSENVESVLDELDHQYSIVYGIVGRLRTEPESV
jgi:hypothetical protein